MVSLANLNKNIKKKTLNRYCSKEDEKPVNRYNQINYYFSNFKKKIFLLKTFIENFDDYFDIVNS